MINVSLWYRWPLFYTIWIFLKICVLKRNSCKVKQSETKIVLSIVRAMYYILLRTLCRYLFDKCDSSNFFYTHLKSYPALNCLVHISGVLLICHFILNWRPAANCILSPCPKNSRQCFMHVCSVLHMHYGLEIVT